MILEIRLQLSDEDRKDYGVEQGFTLYSKVKGAVKRDYLGADYELEPVFLPVGVSDLPPKIMRVSQRGQYYLFYCEWDKADLDPDFGSDLNYMDVNAVVQVAADFPTF